MTIVVDAGRPCWLIGRAGDDAPSAGIPGAGEFAAQRTGQRMRASSTNWQLFEEYLCTPGLRTNGTCLFAVGLFDEAKIREISEHVLSPESACHFTHLHFVTQELLVLFSYGRTTGIVVYISGNELSILGVWDNCILGETARRVDMMATEADFEASPDDWERRTLLGDLLSGAIEAAPIDCRKDLLCNVVVGCGSWGAWNGMDRHISRILARWVERRCPATRVEVAMQPEAGCSAYIGGSIISSINTNSLDYLTLRAWREHERARSAGFGAQRDEQRPARLARGEGHPERWTNGRGWDALLVPADAAEYSARRLGIARVLVRAAPSLCVALPADLLEVVAAWLTQQLRWPELASPRAAAFLPPEDDRCDAPTVRCSADEPSGMMMAMSLDQDEARACWSEKWRRVAAEVRRGVPSLFRVHSPHWHHT